MNISTTKWGAYTLVDVDSTRIQQCISFARERQFDGFCITPHSGYRLHDLEFLKDCPWIRALVLYNAEGIDVTAVSSLPDLRMLSADTLAHQIDLPKLTTLRELYLEWNRSMRASQLPRSLTTFHARKFKSDTEDLRDIDRLRNLRDLSLVQTSIKSLTGVSDLTRLERLEVSYSRTLADISELASGRLSRLARIEFAHCSSLQDYAPAASLTSLSELLILDCAPIRTLSFVPDCPRLANFRFNGTDVEDGDLSPLLRARNLKSLYFTNKKTFSHRRSDFPDLTTLPR